MGRILDKTMAVQPGALDGDERLPRREPSGVDRNPADPACWTAPDELSTSGVEDLADRPRCHVMSDLRQRQAVTGSNPALDDLSI